MDHKRTFKITLALLLNRISNKKSGFKKVSAEIVNNMPQMKEMEKQT